MNHREKLKQKKSSKTYFDIAISITFDMDTFQDHDMGNPQQGAPSQGHRVSSPHHVAVPHTVQYGYAPSPGQHVPYANPATESHYPGPGLVQYGHPAFPYSAHPYAFGTMPPRPMAPPPMTPLPELTLLLGVPLSIMNDRQRGRDVGDEDR